MSVTYIDAIHDAQKDLLTEDKDVFLYGQDIGVFGGAFKATKGLKDLFPDRVIDAPISEDAMAGMVTGAAVMGKKPIMEVQFADFSTIAFNQIVNMAATHYYRTGIPANITVRLPAAERRHGPLPQPEHGSPVRPLSRSACYDAGHGGGRLLDAAPGRGNP